MLKWFSNDEGGPDLAAPGSPPGAAEGPGRQPDPAELQERLSQTEQLVSQLKALIREKEAALQTRDQQLKASDAKLSKMRLQHKAKVTSLSAQLEDLRKENLDQGSSAHSRKGGGEAGDQASRGKVLLFRKRVEELEHQLSKKDEELEAKTQALASGRQRGEHMDAMLQDRERRLLEKEAYIIHLQTALAGPAPAALAGPAPAALAGPAPAAPALTPGEQLVCPEEGAALLDLQVQNLTRRVGEGEERCSLLEEQNHSLKNLLLSERTQHEEKENMYKQNIQTFKDIIQQKDSVLAEVNQKHEQELFKMVAKQDASSDLEQLLKALKQKLHEKEEVLQGKNQVISVLQEELDGRDQQIQDLSEHARRLQVERENLRSQMEAEKHVMRAQLKDRMQSHEAELRDRMQSHEAQLRSLEAEHRAELAGAEQTAAMTTSTPAPPLGGVGGDAACRVAELEAQAKLKTEEASKSEAKFLKMKAWSKSRIRQLEEELRKGQGGGAGPDLSALRRHVTELEEEREENSWRLEQYDQVKAQNDVLQAKLILYEEQQRKMQSDLEQVTKRAASQASESGSAEDGQLLEWQEMLSEGGAMRSRGREDKTPLGLRMANMEEDREVLAGQQQGMEGELAQARALEVGRGRRPGGPDQRSLEEEFEFDGRHGFPDQSESSTPMEGENMGEGLRSVVEDLEQERNQLQEQMVLLEERCGELEDRLQMQTRIETLQVTFDVNEESLPFWLSQNDSARLQTQLSSLRSQQGRDAEKHQLLVASLNEQLKGLSETQECLESSLLEKDARLAQTADTQELLDELRDSIKSKDAQHRDLSDKLQQAQQSLIKVSEDCKSFEKQCSELKTSEADLSQKLSELKEKTQKQEATIETLQSDLDQATDELDKINTAHLEERAQLIHDLQTCEREMDLLKDVLQERDRDIAALQGSMAEHGEQISKLTREIKLKEEQLVLSEGSLTKAERETQILRDSQDSDQRSLNARMVQLAGQLQESQEELSRLREEREEREGDVQELTKQIQEDKRTVQDLRRDIQKQNVLHSNHLSECEAQMMSLKDQVTTASQKLQESNSLISQLRESDVSSEELKHQLLDKEQTYEDEMKSFKEERNKLLAELDKLNLELQTLSKQLEEKSENVSKLEELLKSTETENKQLQTDVRGTTEKLKSQKKHVDGLSKKLKSAVDQNAQLKTQVNSFTENNLSLQTELAEMTKSNSELLNEKSDLQGHISVFELQKSGSNEIIQGLQKDKEDLSVRVHKLNEVLEQNKQSFSEMLQEKTNECTNIRTTLSASEAEATDLQEQADSLNTQLQQLRDNVDEKEKTVLHLRCQLTTLENEAADNIKLRQEVEQRQAAVVSLQSHIQALTEENQRLHADYDIREKELSQQKQVASELDSKVTVTLEQSSVMGLQLNNLTEQNQKLQQEVATKEKFITKLNTDNSSLQEKISSLKMQHAENHKIMDGLLKEKEDLRVATEELKKVLEQNKHSLSESLREKTQECSELSRAVREKDETAARLQENIDSLNSQIHQLHNHIQEKQQALTEQSSQINIQREQLSQLQETLSLLQEQGAALKAGLLEKSAALLQSAEECGSLRQESELQRDGLSKLQVEADALRGERLELSRRLEEKEETLKRTTGEYQNSKDELDQRNETVRSLGSQLGVVKENKEKLEVEVTHLRTALETHASENARLRQEVVQKQKEVVDLRDKMKSLNEELNKVLEQTKHLLSESLREKTQECSELSRAVREKDETAARLQENIDSLNSQIHQLHNHIQEKQQALTEQSSQINIQREQLSQLQETLSLLQEQGAALKAGLLEKSAALLQSAEECGSLRQESELQRDGLSKLQVEADALRGERLELSRRLEEKEETLKRTTGEYQNSKDELDQRNETVRSLGSQLGVVKENKEKLEVEVTHLRTALETHASENARLRQDVAQKQKEVVDLRDKMKSLNKELNKVLEQTKHLLSESLREKTQECSELSRAVREKDETAARLQENIDSLNSQIHQLHNHIQEKQQALTEQSSQINIQREQLSQLQETLSLLQEQGAALKAGLLEKSAALLQSAEECGSLRQEAELQRDGLSKLQVEADALRGERLELSRRLEEKEETLKRTTGEYQNSKDELDQRNETVRSLGSQLGVVKENKEKLEVEVTHLRTALETHASENARLRQDVAQKQKEVVDLRDKMQSLNEQNMSLNSELQRVVTEASKSLEETSVVRSENMTRDGQISKLTEQLNAACTHKDGLESTLQQKDKKIRLQQVLVKKLKAMVEEVKGETGQKVETITELQAQVRHLQETIVDRDESLRDSEKERSVLEEQLRSSETLNLTDSESLRVQLHSSVETTKHLQSELTRLKEENLRMCGDLTERDTQLKQVVDGSILIKTRVSELEDVISQLRGSLDSLTAESSHLKDSLKDKEQAIADHKRLSSIEIKRLHLNLQAKESECESLRGEASGLQEFISKLNNNLLSQASEAASLKESLQSQAGALHALQGHAEESARLNAQLAERTQLAAQLQSQLQVLSAESEKLSRTVEDNQSAFVNLQEKYTALLEEHQDARKALSQKAEELYGLRGTLDDRTAEVQTAESASETLKNESLFLRQELQRLQTINLSLSEQQEDSLAAHHSITSALTAEVEMFKSQCLHTAAQVQVLTEQLQQKETAVQSVNSQYAALVKRTEHLTSQMKRLEDENKELEGETALTKQEHQQQLDAVLKEKAQLQREMWAVVAERDEARSLQKKREEVRTHQKQEQLLLLSSGGKEVSEKMAASKENLHSERSSIQQEVLSVEEAPGAPQERSSAADVINTLAASQLHERLGELQRRVDQLNQTVSEERSRRAAVEEALRLAEDRVSESGSPQRDVSIQMETEDQWEGLVLDPNEPLLTRKVRGGVLAWRRWLRGRSLYCSKLLRTRGRSRYLFLSYLVTLHLVLLLCLTGVL
ncbi:uncharacterized protein si:ch211-220f16.2 isoform X2 [Osmerus eperlanus]|uniref:uncharacterized protein si:ch211-220f16.2 isoform X2 n=1 Tax=Osmerus eperlanus TaxID=29151 RepID=UPI002E0D34E9